MRINYTHRLTLSSSNLWNNLSLLFRQLEHAKANPKCFSNVRLICAQLVHTRNFLNAFLSQTNGKVRKRTIRINNSSTSQKINFNALFHPILSSLTFLRSRKKCNIHWYACFLVSIFTRYFVKTLILLKRVYDSDVKIRGQQQDRPYIQSSTAGIFLVTKFIFFSLNYRVIKLYLTRTTILFASTSSKIL